MFTACEKDENENQIGQEYPNNVKNKTAINKSEIETDHDLSEFIEDVLDESGLDSMEAELAFLYTESTLYWRLWNDEAPGVTLDTSFQIDVDLVQVNGEWVIDGSDILSLNQDIHQELVDIAENVTLPNVATGQKFWLELDIDYPDPVSFSSLTTVTVNAILAGAMGSRPCLFSDDWHGYNEKKCDNSSNGYVVDVMNRRLNDLGCSYSNIEYCYLVNVVPYGIDRSPQVWGRQKGYLWYDLSYECVSAQFLNVTSMPAILTYGDQQRPSFQNNPMKIKSYNVTRSAAPQGKAEHNFKVTYFGKCKKVTLDPIHRLFPMY